VLFGVGHLLRSIDFSRQAATVDPERLPKATSPKYPLRGHQLGYRPKRNAYDAWTVEIWDQYIRDLAVFGTNAIEIIPPRSDDEPDSPLFPLPPDQMMVEMSRIADSYGLDVSVWYPAMDKDYSDPQTVAKALDEWEAVFKMVPRIDVVFVPGGDPGHTEPKYLLALLQKQKVGLRKYHPKA
jgi:sugar phosphate isomerase/epimerase